MSDIGDENTCVTFAALLGGGGAGVRFDRGGALRGFFIWVILG